MRHAQRLIGKKSGSRSIMVLMRMTVKNLAIRASACLCEMVAIFCLLAGVATAAYILKQPAHLPASESPATTKITSSPEMAGELSSR
jgi:hypothetical protein